MRIKQNWQPFLFIGILEYAIFFPLHNKQASEFCIVE